MPPSAASHDDPSRPAFREDIEGLRGWLAAVIVLYHLVGIPLGGVIGVDVFFVISGFLITGLLLRELDETGRVSLAAFYARRARRILPVAGVVLVVTVAAAPLVWFAPRAVRTALDAVAAASFVENWHLIASQRSYLQHDAGVSPLQHFWSLAVEEQFYIAWPLVVIAGALVAARFGSVARRRSRTRAVLSVAAIAFLLPSVAHASIQTASDIDAAYFDTFSRAWEFVPGILAATGRPLLARVPRHWRRVLLWTGAASIAFACVFVDPHVAFPWPRAVFATLGTALIVGFGTDDEGLITRLLALPPARWLGKRSYSLYLWHFPAAVMIPAVLGRSWWALLVALAVTGLLTTLSYRLVERPALRSGWLRRLESPPDRRRRHHRRRLELAGVAGLALVVVGSGSLQLAAPEKLGDPLSLALPLGGSATDSATGSTPASAQPFSSSSIGAGVREGADRDSWPSSLSPALDRAFGDSLPAAFDMASGCRNDPRQAGAPRSCLWNPDGKRTVTLIGDSTAAAWSSAVTTALVPRGWRVEALSYNGCSPFDVPTPRAVGSQADCRRSRSRLIEQVAESHPDLVLVSSGIASYSDLATEHGRRAADSLWAAGTRRTVSRLAELSPRVVVVENPPPGQSVVDCATRAGSPRECALHVGRDHVDAGRAELQGIQDADTSRPTPDSGIAGYLPTSQWFCTSAGVCPVVVGGRLVRPDRSHLTDAMSRALGGLLREALGD